MTKSRKCIQIPISDKSNTMLSRDDINKLIVLAGYEGVSVGRYIAKLIKADIHRRDFIFN